MKYGKFKKLISLCLAVSLLSATAITAVADETAQGSANIQNSIADTDDSGNLSDYYSYKESVSAESVFEGEISLNIAKTVNKDNTVNFSADVPQDALYAVKFKFKAVDNGTVSMSFAFKIDGEYPFDDASEISLPRMWTDSEKRYDGVGNQISSKHIPYDELYTYTLTDTNESGVEYLFLLGVGTHDFSIESVSGEFYIEDVILSAPMRYEEYKTPENGNFYSGKSIIIEGEDAVLKNSYSLVGKSDSASAEITPKNTKLQLINYIGGSNWSDAGETISWETEVPESGYYRIGFSFRQSTVLNGVSYRMLTVDGEVPFAEAADIRFEYGYDWQKKFFADSKGIPYLVYLTKGKHEIALTVVSGIMGDVRRLLNEAVS